MKIFLAKVKAKICQGCFPFPQFISFKMHIAFDFLTSVFPFPWEKFGKLKIDNGKDTFLGKLVFYYWNF